MSDTEREALCKRIDELCQEVESWRMVATSRTKQCAEVNEANDALQAENARLRDEVERLHADQAHWELGNCPQCPNVVSLQEALEQNARLQELADGAANEADRLTHDAAALQIENAKLRMLCADMWEAIKAHKRINFAQLLQFGERIRKLRIEVD